MTLTAKPHEVSEDLSIRAMGIADSGAHQWALSLIGVAPDDSISLSYGKESLPIQRVERPEDGIGPTKVYISEETFLTMAETETVTLQVGETRVTLPSALREEMKKIFETVT